MWIANHNSPTQTVIAGTEEGVTLASQKLQAAGIRSQRIAVACGFHSPLIAGAKTGTRRKRLSPSELRAPTEAGVLATRARTAAPF